ncbi:MAG: transcriptional repressor [Kordiimonadaceae bacterium]|nr:transcriptional repressor [Kordiimonadaceae bacterium]MBO6567272.1 transcriptional repressor [Kordiimonadaceae bacterium]MBO6963514.1 transcriptional repressor [Kordiimonadaceae bacterium]
MTIEPVRPEGRRTPIGDTIPESKLPPLTGNQRMVYEALLGLGRAAKAYELLDMLRADGVKAAPTVYRALHELRDKGLVQHIVSSRTFVALKEVENNLEESVTFICEDCGEARTMESKQLINVLKSQARKSGFSVKSYHVEIATSCGGECKARTS